MQLHFEASISCILGGQNNTSHHLAYSIRFTTSTIWCRFASQRKLISEAWNNEQYGYLIRDLFIIINWIVLLYTMAHGTTLAFRGYTSQEVIVVPLTQDTLYSDEHSEVLVKVS
jgi:hypothetical protein